MFYNIVFAGVSASAGLGLVVSAGKTDMEQN